MYHIAQCGVQCLERHHRNFGIELGYSHTLLYLRDVRHYYEHFVTLCEHFEHSLTFVNFCNCRVIAIE